MTRNGMQTMLSPDMKPGRAQLASVVGQWLSIKHVYLVRAQLALSLEIFAIV